MGLRWSWLATSKPIICGGRALSLGGILLELLLILLDLLLLSFSVVLFCGVGGKGRRVPGLEDEVYFAFVEFDLAREVGMLDFEDGREVPMEVDLIKLLVGVFVGSIGGGVTVMGGCAFEFM